MANTSPAERFAQGYEYGFQSGKEPTIRELENAHPDWSVAEVDAYIQGALDGVVGDDWRLKHSPAQERLI